MRFDKYESCRVRELLVLALSIVITMSCTEDLSLVTHDKSMEMDEQTFQQSLSNDRSRSERSDCHFESSDAVELGEIEDDAINEASGLAMGIRNPNTLWTHNDSGGSENVFAMDVTGVASGTYNLEGSNNVDWEDISTGPGPDGDSYIYIGDIGDNANKRGSVQVYRFKEPRLSLKESQINEEDLEVLEFKYPNGDSKDSETLLVDPLTKDIYLISKQDGKFGIYLSEYPQSVRRTNRLQHLGDIRLSNINGGDVSGDGTQLLLRNAQELYHWCLDRSTIENLRTDFHDQLKGSPYLPPYKVEVQGEAICWDKDSQGFYTTSEERRGRSADIDYYKKI
jgi:hypothetical protein